MPSLRLISSTGSLLARATASAATSPSRHSQAASSAHLTDLAGTPVPLVSVLQGPFSPVAWSTSRALHLSTQLPFLSAHDGGEYLVTPMPRPSSTCPRPARLARAPGMLSDCAALAPPARGARLGRRGPRGGPEPLFRAGPVGRV